jgi:hypothetical protein
VVRKNKTPIYNEDDDSFLGFIVNDGTTWQAVTIFGYLISRTTSRADAEAVLKDQGPTYLKGIWQYYDKDDKEWFPCVIKQAFEQRVIVNRTNNLGFQDPEDYKQVLIEDPSENDLVKSN